MASKDVEPIREGIAQFPFDLEMGTQEPAAGI